MLPVIPKPPITRGQKRAAIAVAGAVDLLQVGLLPALGFGYVLDNFLDIIAAIVLTAICGFKWQFVLAFGLELVPALDLFPTWTAVALMLPTAPAGSPGVMDVHQRLTVTPVEGQGHGTQTHEGEIVDVEAVERSPGRVN